MPMSRRLTYFINVKGLIVSKVLILLSKEQRNCESNKIKLIFTTFLSFFEFETVGSSHASTLKLPSLRRFTHLVLVVFVNIVILYGNSKYIEIKSSNNARENALLILITEFSNNMFWILYFHCKLRWPFVPDFSEQSRILAQRSTLKYVPEDVIFW